MRGTVKPEYMDRIVERRWHRWRLKRFVRRTVITLVVVDFAFYASWLGWGLWQYHEEGYDLNFRTAMGVMVASTREIPSELWPSEPTSPAVVAYEPVKDWGVSIGQGLVTFEVELDDAIGKMEQPIIRVSDGCSWRAEHKTLLVVGCGEPFLSEIEAVRKEAIESHKRKVADLQDKVSLARAGIERAEWGFKNWELEQWKKHPLTGPNPLEWEKRRQELRDARDRLNAEIKWLEAEIEKLRVQLDNEVKEKAAWGYIEQHFRVFLIEAPVGASVDGRET